MATKKITELTNVTSVQDTDLLLVETSEGTRSINKGNIISSTEKDTWNAKADGGHNHVNGAIFPAYVELTPTVGSNHGGYLDFHFNGDSADYTSRIIESASGQITITSQTRVGNADPNTGLARNIFAGTADLVAGSSAMITGEIYIVYE